VSHHVKPDDLARELDLDEDELLRFCLRESIPVLHGRIDRSLVIATQKANEQTEAATV
jgi:hypothetical protein